MDTDENFARTSAIAFPDLPISTPIASLSDNSMLRTATLALPYKNSRTALTALTTFNFAPFAIATLRSLSMVRLTPQSPAISAILLDLPPVNNALTSSAETTSSSIKFASKKSCINFDACIKFSGVPRSASSLLSKSAERTTNSLICFMAAERVRSRN